MHKLLFATLAAVTLAGCGAAPSLTAPQTNAAGFNAAGKKAEPAPRQGLFKSLVGMVSVPEHWEKPAVDFEFGTQGLLGSDAVRKQPTITLNGKDYDAYGYTITAAEDGVLYVASKEQKDRHYVLGTWEKPKELKVGMFRQKVKVKLPEHTFKVKRPLNPMSHITFLIDLKAPLEVAKKAPQPFYISR